MKMLQEMKNQQGFGEVTELKIFHILEKKTIGGDQQDSQDLVDQIQKFFIGLGILNFHLQEVLFEMMKKIGWKSGITYLWNT
jgi:hypothetical protein